MNNDILVQKSWVKRHCKWFVPLVGVMLILIYILLSSGFHVIFADYSNAYANSEIYEDALEKVRKNERVKEVLGTVAPMGNTAILNGALKYSNDNRTINATIKIFCAQGKAMLDIIAHRVNDTWHYEEIKVRIKNPLERRETIKIVSSNKKNIK